MIERSFHLGRRLDTPRWSLDYWISPIPLALFWLSHLANRLGYRGSTTPLWIRRVIPLTATFRTHRTWLQSKSETYSPKATK